MQHVLLASVVHNAGRLDHRGADSETEAWVRYLTRYFPPGRNSGPDARLLWTDWRTSLLKKQAPGPGVLTTHGHSPVHWGRDRQGRLCINLEDMWADFANSVDAFIDSMRTAPDRRSIAIRRARESSVAVIEFTTTISLASAPASGVASAYVAAGSIVAYAPPETWPADC